MPVSLLPPLPLPALHPLRLPWLDQAGVDCAILRLDAIDPLISGNKSYKLQHHLQAARDRAAPGVISLGGNHSNHLHALAAAGLRHGFATAGLMRGEPQDTPTVRDLRAMGMHLHWLGYGGYRARHRSDFWAPWQAQYPGWHCLPEGGADAAGALGCTALVAQARQQLPSLGWDDYDGWWLAVGTGATMAGLVLAEQGTHPVHGALAVRRDQGVPETVARLAGIQGWQLHDACRGGFGRLDERLLAFVEQCEDHSGVPFEALYTGKALMALHEQVEAGRFVRGTRLVVVHTGGLQGRRGYLPGSMRSSGSSRLT